MGMVEISNKLFEKVLRKNSRIDMKWNQQLSKGERYINMRIITYLEFSSSFILFESFQKTFIIIFKFIIFPGRDIRVWVKEFNDFN